jgi:tetratricopeptide (TPR) repeat protein
MGRTAFFRVAVMIAGLFVGPAFADDASTCTNDDQSKPDQRIEACTRWIQTRPRGSSMAQAYNSRGTAWFLKKDYDRAIADFGIAVRVDETLAAAFANRAWAYHHKAEYDQAIADCDQTIHLIAPELADGFRRGSIPRDLVLAQALAIRGSAVREKGDYDRAISDISAAISARSLTTGGVTPDLPTQFPLPASWIFNERGLAYRPRVTVARSQISTRRSGTIPKTPQR